MYNFFKNVFLLFLSLFTVTALSTEIENFKKVADIESEYYLLALILENSDSEYCRNLMKEFQDKYDNLKLKQITSSLNKYNESVLKNLQAYLLMHLDKYNLTIEDIEKKFQVSLEVAEDIYLQLNILSTYYKRLLKQVENKIQNGQFMLHDGEYLLGRRGTPFCIPKW